MMTEARLHSINGDRNLILFFKSVHVMKSDGKFLRDEKKISLHSLSDIAIIATIHNR